MHLETKAMFAIKLFVILATNTIAVGCTVLKKLITLKIHLWYGRVCGVIGKIFRKKQNIGRVDYSKKQILQRVQNTIGMMMQQP